MLRVRCRGFLDLPRIERWQAQGHPPSKRPTHRASAEALVALVSVTSLRSGRRLFRYSKRKDYLFALSGNAGGVAGAVAKLGWQPPNKKEPQWLTALLKGGCPRSTQPYIKPVGLKVKGKGNKKTPTFPLGASSLAMCSRWVLMVN